MRTEIIYIFKHNDIELERAVWDLETCDIEIIKGCLATSRGIKFDDIDIEMLEVYKPDLSDRLFVRGCDGSLMQNHLLGGNPNVVTGLMPSMDISHEEFFYEFLDLISKKDIDNAINFSYIW